MVSKRAPQEGLIRVPLVRAMLTDPLVRVVPRGVDMEWSYAKVTPITVTGFNPYRRELYIGASSASRSWMEHGCVDDRRFNESDHLVREVLFLAHDYLHCWAVAAIQHLMPELGFGHAPITKDTIEAFTFCHILTEAVATVGLDYWYLGTIHLDDLCKVGTTTATLTASFHQDSIDEYRRFNPELDVQSPAFLEKFSLFYCSGVWDAFALEDLRASPKLLRWLEHELSYSVKQREYARSWLCHLSDGAVNLPREALGKPIEVTRRWQRTLIRKLSRLTWDKINGGAPPLRPRVPRTAAWRRASPSSGRDFRFVNLNRVKDVDAYVRSGASRDDHFAFFFSQWVAAHDFASFPREEVVILKYLLEKRDAKTLLYLFRKNQTRRLPIKAANEPVEIFIPN